MDEQEKTLFKELTKKLEALIEAQSSPPPKDGYQWVKIIYPGNIDNKSKDLIATSEGDSMIVRYSYKTYTISKRKDGRWHTRYTDNGKQISVYGHTAEEARRNLKSALRELKQKNAKKKEKTYSFFEWMNFWYETYKKPYNKSDSIIRQIRTHVTVGKDMPLTSVTTTHLQIIVNNVPTMRTRVDVTNILKTAFDIAFKTRVITDNPAITLAKLSYKSKNGSALTQEEEKQFLSDIKGHYLESLFNFYILTGCRRSEAFKFNVKDVDRKKGIVHIHGTKTQNSERIIPLFKRLDEYLQTLTPDENGYYFASVHEDTVTRDFKRFCSNHKLHDLRHTFATRCLEAGVNMKTVQIWLGHADFETTANIYSHVNLDFQKEQALRLNSYFDTNSDTILNQTTDTIHSKTTKK